MVDVVRALPGELQPWAPRLRRELQPWAPRLRRELQPWASRFRRDRRRAVAHEVLVVVPVAVPNLQVVDVVRALRGERQPWAGADYFG